MARLSDVARSERRDSIIAAAAERFSSQGFHATSMAEIISDSGVAAGTVYMHFASKDDLIVATAEQALDGVGRTLAGLLDRDPAPSLAAFLTSIRTSLPSDASGALRAHLVLHSWAETSRNPRLAALVSDRCDALLAGVNPLISMWRERGEMPSDLSSAELGRDLLALVQGHIVQAAVLSGGRDPRRRAVPDAGSDPHR